MTRRDRDTDNAGQVTTGGDNPSISERAQLMRRPNFNGDLNTMLESDPGFRVRLSGYDRLQVSNYVTWVEAELLSRQRLCEETLHANADLAARLGACQAELRRLKQQVAESANNADPAHLSDRVHDILQLAADEATDIRAAREAEADQVLAQVRSGAAAALQEAHADAQRIVQAATAEQERTQAETARRCADRQDEAERILATTRTTAAAVSAELEQVMTQARADASAELEQARAGAERIRVTAANERARLDTRATEARERADAEAAERLAEAEAASATRLSAIQQQVNGLDLRRDRALDALRQLHDQLTTVLPTVQQRADSVSAAG
jgi:cell division septum initiation protein DivIVA